MTDVKRKLFSLKDEKYKVFHSRLMPTVPSENVIGIRVPVLRSFAKDFSKTPESIVFMKNLPHTYYEENNLHAFLIEGIKDYDTAISETERFLPYIDNWATCDSFKPKVFKKNSLKLIPKINLWLKSSHPYTVRYAIGLLMSYFLDEHFSPGYLDTVASIKSKEYYVKMMVAWYFTTALTKQYEHAIKYLTEKRLDPWIHNKTIQKAVESYCISPETKDFLRNLRIKTD